MMVDKERAAAILKCLSEEFGITTEKELNEDLAKQERINITPFVSLPPKRDSDGKNE